MPHIHLKNNYVEFDIEFKQKYLFIRGDSGIGKTTLVDMVSAYKSNPEAVDCLGDDNLELLYSERDLVLSNCIFFIDENNPLLHRGDVAKLFNKSNNYFVIINRSRKFNNLKSGLDSLVEMISDENGYHTVKLCHPRKEHLNELGSCLVSEDSNSGRKFLEKVFQCNIESAASKEKLAMKLKKLGKQDYTIIYDRSGISFSYEDQMDFLYKNGISIVSEIDWDSFEAYVLESPEYNVEVPWYPDKERNAKRLFKRVIDEKYNKSDLPENIKFPIYWKVSEALELIQGLVHMEAF